MLVDPHSDHVGLLTSISYGRCSTARQIEGSPDRQHENNQTFADRRSWGACIQVEDLAVSGRTSTRVGLDWVWNFCGLYPLTPIIVEDLSRLVRGHVAFAHALLKIDEVMAVVYESRSNRFLSYQEIIRAAAQAIEEYVTLLRRHQDGHDLAGRRGGLMTKAPTGILRDKNKRPYADPEWEEIITEIFNRMAGDEQIATITKDLNARRIPSPGKGKGWTHGHLHGLVSNPLYRGVMMHRRKAHHYDPHVVKHRANLRRQELQGNV